MPAANSRDLYLQIGATIDPLKTAMVAGRTVINEFGVAGAAALLDLDKKFASLADSGAGSAKQLEKSYTDSLKRIQSAARAALSAPNAQASFAIVNAHEAQEAAANAARVATELRQVADAANRARLAQEGDNRAITAYAVAAEAAARGAEKQAIGLREQAATLESVRAQLVEAGVAQEHMTETVLEGHRRMGASGLIFEHIIRASGDSFAAGLPPAQIFAEQLGRVAEAAQFLAIETNATSGVMGKFASFMGGEWGIAVSFAVSALVPLINNLKLTDDEVGDAIEKLKDQAHETDISRQAADAFAKTIDGQTESVRKNTEELERNIYTQEQRNRLAVQQAQSQLRQMQQTQSDAEAELDQRQKKLAVAKAISSGGSPDEIAAADAVTAAQNAVEEQLKLVNQGRINISRQQEGIRLAQGQVADDRAEANVDPKTSIKVHFDDLETGVKLQLQQGKISAEIAERGLTALKRERQAALDVEQAREHPKRGRGTSASEESALGNMVTLLKQLIPDATITSTNAGNHVANSDHYQDRAIDFVVPGLASFTREQAEAFKAQVRETLTSAGVRIRRNAQGVEQLFVAPYDAPERGHSAHIHFAFEGRPSLDSYGRRAQAQENTFTRDRDALGADVEAAERDRDRAILALKPAADQELALNLAIIASDAQKLKDKAAERVSLAKVSDAQRKILQADLARYDAAVDAATAAKEDAARRNEHEKQIAKGLETAKAQFAADAEFLRLQIALADTAKERNALQQKLLDNELAAAKAGPLSVLGDKDATGDARASAQSQLDQLARTAPLKQQQLNDASLDPVQKLISDWQKASTDITTSLKTIEADGLKSLSDHIANVLDGTESAKKAFKSLADSAIADLTRLAVKFALSKLFPGSDSGGGGGVGVLTSIASLFAAKGYVPGFAGGGFVDPRGIIHGPGTPTSDSILARVSRDEAIMNARAVRRYAPLLDAMNKGTLPSFADGGFASGISYPALPSAASMSSARPIAAQQVFDLRGSVTTEQLLADVNQRVQRGAAVAVTGGAALAQANIDLRAYQRIPT